MSYFTKHTNEWTSYFYHPMTPSDSQSVMSGVYLAQLGRLYSSGGFKQEQVAFCAALHFVKSGQGVMRVDGRPYEVAAGDIFAFFPGRHYYYFDRRDTPWHYTWAALLGKHTEEAMAAAGITQERPHWQGDFANLLEPLFREVVEMYQQPETPATFPIAAAWRMLDLLSRHGTQTSKPVEQHIAERAKAFMDDHFMMMLSIEEIAERLRISRSTLFRKFRERYQVSPKDYLDAVRLSHAQQLLQKSQSSIKEIAAACGYLDGHYFSRAFKKAFGYPPSRER